MNMIQERNESEIRMIEALEIKKKNELFRESQMKTVISKFMPLEN